MISRKDGRNIQTTYGYNNGGQLTTVTYPTRALSHRAARVGAASFLSVIPGRNPSGLFGGPDRPDGIPQVSWQRGTAGI